MVASLGIGTATFAGGYGIAADPPSAEAGTALVRLAVEGGIRYVDTAGAYGASEAILGSLSALLTERRVRLCTKVRASLRGAKALVGQARAALDRLGASSVDTVLLHSASPEALAAPSTVEGMARLLGEGLARHVGASTYGLETARAALAQPWCGVVQVEHSILNPSVVAGLAGERAGVEVVARSVLCKGLLTPRRKLAAGVGASLAALLDSLDVLASAWGYALPELAIRFALDTPRVGVVVIGVSTAEEIATALGALARPPLEPEQRRELAAFGRPEEDLTHPERWPSGLEHARP